MANPNVILQWNCNGLKGNRLELEILIAEYSPAVICLQETRLNTEVEKAQKDVNSLPSFVRGHAKFSPFNRPYRAYGRGEGVRTLKKYVRSVKWRFFT